MTDQIIDKYSAREPGLGYLYQSRLALLRLLELPENTTVFLEKEDDVDFEDDKGVKSLLSLKHRAAGTHLTDLSVDFWKSVRIWLVRYESHGRSTSSLRFFLFTTSKVSDGSFLTEYVSDGGRTVEETTSLVERAEQALSKSKSTLIGDIAEQFNELTLEEKHDFLTRILIFDESPRIEKIPGMIKDSYLRSIRREHRNDIFERLEGWWNDEAIKQLTGIGNEGVHGFEVSDKLSALSEEYKLDNLPITFRTKTPAGEIDTENDPRCFVKQLQEIGVTSNRIRNAILDYYRAFEQRSEWARASLLVSGEIEGYEDRLVDEWGRYRDVVFEELTKDSAEDVLQRAGKELYKWADLQSGNIDSLRIRERVTEPVHGELLIIAGNQRFG